MAERSSKGTSDSSVGAAEVDEYDARIDELEETVRRLERRLDMVEALVRNLGGAETSSRFLEHRDVMWKRTDEGKWIPAPYCPACRVRYNDVDHLIYQCPRCKQRAPFKPVEMKKILAELPAY